jgi:hypothetical protein
MTPTCKPCPIGPAARQNTRPLPEDPSDSPATVSHLTEVASGDDGYWPQRVESAFTKVGFGVRRLAREEYHPTVWVIWLTRGSVDLPKDNKVASNQVRRALAKLGLKIRAGELTVLEQRGDRLRCAFMCGTPAPPIDIPPLSEADLGDGLD